MADRQFSKLKDTGPSAPLRDIYSYFRGEGTIGSPESYFPGQERKKGDFLEMLARLLSEKELREVGTKWAYPNEKNAATLDAKGAAIFALDPSLDAGRRLGQRSVPTYVNNAPVPGKTKIYR